jgi:tetratricopeptide (TPR) repeat protein
MQQTVRNHGFELTVAPVDRQSLDARTADLFVTRFPEKGWKMVGPCEVVTTPYGRKFKRVVRVPEDGVYYFTSRAGDAAGKAPAPRPDEQPQVRVLVDSTQPTVELSSPLGYEKLVPGSVLPIVWKAQDDNFGDAPIRLDYSEDNGCTWQPITDPTDNDGREDWTVPQTKAPGIMIRITATDVSGNLRSVATRSQMEVAGNSAGKPLKPESSIKSLGDETTGDDLLKTKHPEMDGNAEGRAYFDQQHLTSSHAAYVAYLMAGNLVRQEKFKEALRYYRTAVDTDNEFDEAWSDAALVYKQLGAFRTAKECIDQALRIEPQNPIYHHHQGEIFQTHGMFLLQRSLGDQDVANADELIHLAVKAYGRAIELGQKQGRLAERAASFFRLGEICYYVNRDPFGARNYWEKVLSLHTPTPNLDDIMHDQGTESYDKTVKIYRRYTEMQVELKTWQGWSEQYIRDLDEMARQGFLPATADNSAIEMRDMHEAGNYMRRDVNDDNAIYGKVAAGKAAYAKPGYGSIPEAGSVRQVVPALPPESTRSVQFGQWADPELAPAARKPYVYSAPTAPLQPLQRVHKKTQFSEWGDPKAAGSPTPAEQESSAWRLPIFGQRNAPAPTYAPNDYRNPDYGSAANSRVVPPPASSSFMDYSRNR